MQLTLNNTVWYFYINNPIIKSEMKKRIMCYRFESYFLKNNIYK